MTLERLRAENQEIRGENEQLRMALITRVVIERAKGVLIERLDLSADDVFQLLGLAAGSAQRTVYKVAAEILETRVTPACVEVKSAICATETPGLVLGSGQSGAIRKSAP